MNIKIRRLAGALLLGASCLHTPLLHADPVQDHPRLWLTSQDLPRLRAWAADPQNGLYQQGLKKALQRAVDTYNTRLFPNGQPNPDWLNRVDGGTSAYVQYPPEAYAEFFAFLSLIDPDLSQRPVHALRARNLLMYVIDRAALGVASGQPYRSPAFAVGDRSRWWGEAFPLTVDWIYSAVDAQGQPVLSAADKAKIRQVFLRWSGENIHAATAGNEHPQPIGVTDSPELLDDKLQLRWAANNFYLNHMRNLTLLSLSMDATDDPPVDPAKSADELGNTLHSYVHNVTGAWLYQTYAMFERPDLVAANLNVPEEGLGMAHGGLPAEGLYYGNNVGRLVQSLLALKTAGYLDSSAAGAPPQTRLGESDYWSQFVDGLLHTLTPTPVTYTDANHAHLGQVYEAANYGDTSRLWIQNSLVDAYSALGVFDYLAGNSSRWEKERWIVANVGEGGAAKFHYRNDSIWGSPSPSRAILNFMMYDPSQPAPADPRPALPTHRLVETGGFGRVLARTDWSPLASWFTYRCSWISINHQVGDCNQIEFYRKGEWLTKEHTSYSEGNDYIGKTPDYHNTLSLQNDTPSSIAWFETGIVARGGQWTEGGAQGDPAVRLSDGEGYVFAEGDATQLYNTKTNPWDSTANAQDIVHASRSVVWLKPDHIVVYDRAVSGHEGRFKRFNLALTGPAALNGDLATLNTAKGQTLHVRTLLPANAVRTVAPVEDVMRRADKEPTTHRLIVETLDSDTRFLHVIQGADGGAGASPATLLESGDGAYQGVAVAGTAVLFRKGTDLAVPASGLSYSAPPGVGLHLVSGLSPLAGYSVAFTNSGSGVTVTITPGGSYTTDKAGVLRVPAGE
jgi:hypothetical protein